MKKVIMVAGGMLILAALGSPFISGVIMESLVRDSFASLNERYAESGQAMRAEIVRYDRGFASSEIEWRITSDSLQAVYDVSEVVFVERAEHNLSGITTRTSLEKNTWYADVVNNRLAGKDPLHISTTYRITGAIATTVAIEAFAVQEGPETLRVKPGQFTLVFDREFKSFSADGSWQGMEVAGKFGVEGLSLKSDLAMISPYIWEGAVHLAMQGSTATGDGPGEQFALSGLKVDSVIAFDKAQKTLSASAEYGADSLFAGTEKIDNLFARVSVKGLDAGRYEEFMKLYTQTMRGLFAELAAARNEPQKMREILDRQLAGMGFELVAAGEKLLTRGLEFQVSGLQLRVAEGEIKGDGDIRLKNDLSFAQLIPVVNQPKLALDILEVKTAVSLPEKLAGDSPLLFSPVYRGMQTGLFVKNGQLAVHAAETRDGKLFLNDKEVLWQ